MNRTTLLTLITSLALAFAAAASGRAQTAAPAPPPPTAEPAPPAGETFFFRFAGVDDAFDRKVVTGAPFSADATTERTQTLADGNRINQTSTAHLYRDSQGRTRREQALGALGPWGAPQDLPPLTMIGDPVAGVSYVLDSRRKVAMEHPLRHGGRAIERKPAFEGGHQESSHRTIASVSLGTETIEGVQAEGSRETTTLAAGAVGNDQPIEIVSERWYSPELQTVVLSKHSDPRFGDTVYRLTNITRQEPPASLFTVPPDYTVKEGENVRFGPREALPRQ